MSPPLSPQGKFGISAIEKDFFLSFLGRQIDSRRTVYPKVIPNGQEEEETHLAVNEQDRGGLDENDFSLLLIPEIGFSLCLDYFADEFGSPKGIE